MSKAQPGYTLLELMIVVILIATVTALAAPQVSEGLHNQAESEAANEIGLMFRAARSLAMQTGVAHRVRVQTGAGPAGAVVVDRGTAAQCVNAVAGMQNFPPGCNFVAPAYGGAGCGMQGMSFNHPYYQSHDVQFRNMRIASVNIASPQAFCITPQGRMVRFTTSAAITTQPVGTPIRFIVSRWPGGIHAGVDRAVHVTAAGLPRIYAEIL